MCRREEVIGRDLGLKRRHLHRVLELLGLRLLTMHRRPSWAGQQLNLSRFHNRRHRLWLLRVISSNRTSNRHRYPPTRSYHHRIMEYQAHRRHHLMGNRNIWNSGACLRSRSHSILCSPSNIEQMEEVMVGSTRWVWSRAALELVQVRGYPACLVATTNRGSMTRGSMGVSLAESCRSCTLEICALSSFFARRKCFLCLKLYSWFFSGTMPRMCTCSMRLG
jgi:hypothetical protein